MYDAHHFPSSDSYTDMANDNPGKRKRRRLSKVSIFAFNLISSQNH